MKSILQNTKECYLCRKKADAMGYYGELSPYNLDRHHVVFGIANRNVSEKTGLWVWVCRDKHHEHGPESPHQNREVALMLMRDGQTEFEKTHTRKEWMSLFGKNYLEEWDDCKDM